MRERMNNIIIAAVLCVLLSGCAVWTQTKVSQYTDDKRHFSAEVPLDWMRYNLADCFLITKDGALLNLIKVYQQKFDEELFATKRRFQADMLPQDMAGVEIDELSANENIAGVSVINNIPVEVDGHEGYRVEYEFQAKGGLTIKGIRIGFKSADRIYRLQYEAAKQHYYDESVSDFEKLVWTFRIQ